MRFKPLGTQTAIVAVALVTGLVAGSLGFGPAIANNLSDQKQIPAAIEYPTNENGETYGSLADAPSPDKAPKLVRVLAEDGTEGYVRYADLIGDLPKNPKEAVEYMKKQEKSRFCEINVYNVDGKIIKGKFKVSHEKGIEIPARK
ncbi:MAG: peptidase M56 BlaR1 [Thermincolia bacterium]